jgi:hypothetical protein
MLPGIAVTFFSLFFYCFFITGSNFFICASVDFPFAGVVQFSRTVTNNISAHLCQRRCAMIVAAIGDQFVRHEAMEDEIKKLEADIQKTTDEFISKSDKYMEIKEKEIMTI